MKEKEEKKGVGVAACVRVGCVGVRAGVVVGVGVACGRVGVVFLLNFDFFCVFF